MRFVRVNLSGDPGHQVYDPSTGRRTGPAQSPHAVPRNIIPGAGIQPDRGQDLAYLPPTNETFTATTQTNDYFALLPAWKTNNQI